MIRRPWLAPIVALLALSGIVSADVGADAGWTALLEGRHDSAEEIFAGALAQDRETLPAAIGLAALSEARGDAGSSAEILASAIESAPHGPLRAGALARLASLTYRMPDGGASAVPALRRVLEGPHDPACREPAAMAALVLDDVLGRMGRSDRARRMLRDEAHRLTEWTLIGPFGRIAPEAMRTSYPPERGEFDVDGLGHGPSGRAPKRLNGEFPLGRVVVPVQLHALGVAYAVTDVIVRRPVDAWLWASGSPSMRVYVDGTLAIEIDRELERPALSSSARLSLPAGRHRVLVKVDNSQRFASFAVSLAPIDGEADVIEVVSVEDRPAESATVRADTCEYDTLSPESVGGRFVDKVAAAWWLRSRDLDRQSGRMVEHLLEGWPQAPIVAYAAGEHLKNASTGSSASEDLRRSRALLERALEDAPDLLRARLLIAEMDLAAGRVDEAASLVEEVLQRQPDDADALFVSHRISRQRGWLFEADRRLTRARAVAPGRSDLLEASVALLDQLGSTERLLAARREVARRKPHDTAWPEYLSTAGRVEEALAAWDAVIAQRPLYLFARLGKLRVLLDADRPDDALAEIEKARELFPDEGWLAFREATAHAFAGRSPEAVLEDLERALELAPERIDVWTTLGLRRGERLKERFFVDVDELLESAAPPEEGMDSALLADTAVVVVDRFGGQRELYQAVHAIYTREGVDQEGELVLQPGARLEGVRIHKADGRKIDVALGSSPPFTLPALEPGDAFEYRWRRYIPPLRVIPGALDNRSIFLFQGPERDYLHSRYVVIHDTDLELEICGNETGLDKEKTREDGRIVHSWTSRGRRRLPLEPDVPNRLEITPHIRLGMNLSWEEVGLYLRTPILSMLHPDDPIPAWTRDVRERAGDESAEALARALHDVVRERIKAGGQALAMGVPASASASAGEQNRLAVALAIAQRLGLDAGVLFARPIEDEGRRLECPTPQIFPYPLLEVRDGEQRMLLNYNDGDHAFDSVPPRFSGSDGLLVPLSRDRTPSLVEVPERSAPLLEKVEADVEINRAGRVSGTLTMTAHASLASVLRRALRELPESRRSQINASFVGQMFGGARVLDSKIDGVEALDGPLTISVSFRDGSLGRVTPDGVAIPVVARPLEMVPGHASLVARRFPLMHDAQEYREDVVRVSWPEGATVLRGPLSLDEEGSFGTYRLSVDVDAESATLRREVRIPPQRISPDDYREFREFAKRIDDKESAELVLRWPEP
jgi:tetratricopeptide (TPR) repeat protein